MDDQLLALMEIADTKDTHENVRSLSVSVSYVDDLSGAIVVHRGDDDPAPVPHQLKPLSQLYGPGRRYSSFDYKSETYVPLFLCIEECVLRHRRQQPELTDGDVMLSLDLLACAPEADVTSHVLARRMQLELRMLLSLNDYNRDEVRQVVRRLRKSVKLHNDLNGRYGYLDFIEEQLVMLRGSSGR